jgi:hypothetical protein
MDPLATLLILVPAFFALGVTLQWTFARFRLTAFNSLLVTFGLTVIVESLIQWLWTADFRRLESAYGTAKFRIAALYVPVPELITLVLAVTLGSLLALLWRRYPGRWVLPAWVLGGLAVILLVALAPVVIDPLFNTSRSPSRSASIRSASRCCSLASVRPCRRSAACVSRFPTPLRRRRSMPGWVSCLPR